MRHAEATLLRMASRSAGADAKDPIVVHEHGVVVPARAIERDALMAGVGYGRSKASNFGCRRFRWQYDFVSEISWEFFEVGDVG